MLCCAGHIGGRESGAGGRLIRLNCEISTLRRKLSSGWEPGSAGVFAHRIRAGFEARGRKRPICLFRNQRPVSLISRSLRKQAPRFLNMPLASAPSHSFPCQAARFLARSLVFLPGRSFSCQAARFLARPPVSLPGRSFSCQAARFLAKPLVFLPGRSFSCQAARFLAKPLANVICRLQCIFSDCCAKKFSCGLGRSSVLPTCGVCLDDWMWLGFVGSVLLSRSCGC
jgi:hypothetical protein